MKTIIATTVSLCLASLPACKKGEPPSNAEKRAPTTAAPGAAAPVASAPVPNSPVPNAPASAAPTSQPAVASPVGAQKAAGSEAAPARRVDGRRVETYGKFTGRPGVVSIAAVLDTPERFAGQDVAITAKVRRACLRKGCWMEVAPSLDKGSQGCRVTFKDYGFFVPLDSAGSDAKVEAVLTVKKVSKSEVDHLESEGARFAKKDADGSAHEVRLIATGVELTRPN